MGVCVCEGVGGSVVWHSQTPTWGCPDGRFSVNVLNDEIHYKLCFIYRSSMFSSMIHWLDMWINLITMRIWKELHETGRDIIYSLQKH